MAFSSCVLCRFVSAFVAVCSFANRLSVTHCIQMWCFLPDMLHFDLTVNTIAHDVSWPIIKRSDISSIERGNAQPTLGFRDHRHFFDTAGDFGSFIHFRMCSKLAESRFWSFQVDPKSRRSNEILVGRYEAPQNLYFQLRADVQSRCYL